MPLTPKQKEYLLSCTHRWNIKIGAVGSGKSFVDVAATIPKRILATRGDGLIVLMGNTRGTLERNILEPMRAIYAGLVSHIRSDNTVEIFGKKCYALGADNKKHVARIQGATFEYVYGDEITTWSEDVFQMLKSRLRTENAHFDGTCNPDTPRHWVKKFLDSDADIFQQAYTIDDGVLPSQVVEELKKEYAGTVYYKRYIEGLWAAAEGLVFPMYEEALEETYEEKALDYRISIDYGTQNPFAALKWKKDASGIWHVVDEFYYSGRDQGHQKTDVDYVGDLVDFTADHPDGDIPTIIDPSAASMMAALKSCGSRSFKIIKADNAVLDGIRDTSTCLQASQGLVKISRKCSNLIDEFQQYVWDDKADHDAPVKEHDHCLTGDTLVETEAGPKPIRELVGTVGNVWSLKDGEPSVCRFHDVRMTQEEAEVFEIELENGISIKATADHPVLTARGWVELKYLRSDDKIACIGGIRSFICENCGRQFKSTKAGSKFCCNACKSAARRNSGVDDESRICKVCGKEFNANKYSTRKTCSGECSSAIRRHKVDKTGGAGACL